MEDQDQTRRKKREKKKNGRSQRSFFFCFRFFFLELISLIDSLRSIKRTPPNTTQIVSGMGIGKRERGGGERSPPRITGEPHQHP